MAAVNMLRITSVGISKCMNSVPQTTYLNLQHDLQNHLRYSLNPHAMMMIGVLGRIGCKGYITGNYSIEL